MTPHGDPSDDIPLEHLRRLDDLCDEVERMIQRGERIDLASLMNRIDVRLHSRFIEETVGILLEHALSSSDHAPLDSLIGQNPALKAEIERAAKACLAPQDTILQETAAGDFAPPAPTPRRRKSRGLRIRCPHCSNHVELVGDASLDSVNCTACGSAFSLVDQATETRMAEALKKVDRFELVSRLGVGGFGTVWKARDTELDRAVAVKIPRYGQLTPTEVEQFLREARSVAQLRHPNIVPVHEVGREGDIVFIVSDFIRGVSLADLLTGKRHSPREAAQLCVTIAKALDHAHRRGVIHRDLKPSNVMIDGDGTPFLMDFGLAKREAEEVTMTVDGQVIGTPAYMSPEQAGGQSAWADRRTDVYSLGVMLFELLTGELPFRGNAQMQVHQRLSGDAPNVRAMNRHLPKDLATICAKCLEREPGSRYQTAVDVADELERFLGQLPIKARPLSPPQRLVRWAIRKPLHATVAALIAILAVGGPATALTMSRQNKVIRDERNKYANLVREREEDVRQAVERNRVLEADLDVWAGRADPWLRWPPAPNASPKRQQLAALLKARGGLLQTAAAGANDLQESQRLLALASLYEASSDDRAASTLQQAAGTLESLYKANPDQLGVALALAECWERLSAATFQQQQPTGVKWLKRARDLRRELADRHPEDALLLANRLDSETRTNAAADFDEARKEILETAARAKQLNEIWPSTTAELYQLACLLAGRQPFLSGSVAEPAENAPRPPTDAGAKEKVE